LKSINRYYITKWIAHKESAIWSVFVTVCLSYCHWRRLPYGTCTWNGLH